MHFRISFAKNPLKHKHSPKAAQHQASDEYFTTQQEVKFKLTHQDNCYKLGNLQTQKLNSKTRVKIPPISEQIHQGELEQLKTLEFVSCVTRPQSNFRNRKGETQRPNFHIRKIAGSVKSTTNQSETKSLSGGDINGHEDFEGGIQHHNASSIKLGISNFTNASTTRERLRHKSTQRCLIGHTKRLPFSLQKRKTMKKISNCENGVNKVRNQKQNQKLPFQVNISSIICKAQLTNFWGDDESIDELRLLY